METGAAEPEQHFYAYGDAVGGNATAATPGSIIALRCGGGTWAAGSLEGLRGERIGAWGVQLDRLLQHSYFT